MIAILQAYLWFDEALQEAMDREGFTMVNRTQSLVMCMVSAGEHRAARIARTLGITRQAINQVVKSLIDTGFLTTRPDPADSRALLIEFRSQSPARDVGIKILRRLETELGVRIGPDKLDGLQAALAEDWGAPPVQEADFHQEEVSA